MKKLLFIILFLAVGLNAYALTDGTIAYGGFSINDAYDFPITDGNSGQVLKTNGTGTLSWQDDTGKTQEEIEDYVGAMVSGNTETLISVDYQDDDGTLDFVVDNDLANYSNLNSAFLTSESDTLDTVCERNATTDTNVQVAGFYATSYLTLPTDTSDTTEGNIRYSSTNDEPQYYDGSAWHYLGSPKLITASDSSQAEGNNSLTGLANKYLIKYLLIETTSTDWDFFIYNEDDYSTGEIQVVANRDGNYNLYLDLPFWDSDNTSEFHYKFTSNSGSETHDITFLGMEMK